MFFYTNSTFPFLGTIAIAGSVTFQSCRVTEGLSNRLWRRFACQSTVSVWKKAFLEKSAPRKTASFITTMTTLRWLLKLCCPPSFYLQAEHHIFDARHEHFFLQISFIELCSKPCSFKIINAISKMAWNWNFDFPMKPSSRTI